MSDKIMRCIDCNVDFEFTAAEAAFFASKNLLTPKRCKDCRAKNKVARGNGAPKTTSFHETECTKCGAPCTVPFQPTPGRTVLCRTCFQNEKNAKV